MDLLQLLPVDSIAKIKTPVTGDELDATINVFGKDSSVFQNAIKQRAKAQIARKSKDIDLDANEKTALSFWQIVQKVGQVLPKVAKSLFLAVMLLLFYTLNTKWIREQIDIAIGDRANFFYQCVEPLKLYVRQQAWWNSCPQTKGAKEYNRITRLQSLKKTTLTNA